ncbi:MAG: hypothetical protein V7K48_07535 [Nostoc sp.]|uniref:hypothetical protein n=1 Tax=Nostoc sp. TaxID=1180 RepID=UPI002FF6F23F
MSQQGGFVHKSFDLLRTFDDVFGQKASHVLEKLEVEELVVDPAMDLGTNTTKSYFWENSLLLQKVRVFNNAIVKIVQTFRTGTNDIDTLDFIHLYLNDENQISQDHVIGQFHGSL